ncbi:hypothetical protein GCM10023080_017070 [Streptomyces pseudoechinosporeus]
MQIRGVGGMGRGEDGLQDQRSRRGGGSDCGQDRSSVRVSHGRMIATTGAAHKFLPVGLQAWITKHDRPRAVGAAQDGAQGPRPSPAPMRARPHVRSGQDAAHGIGNDFT